jgi:hypothetical protein
VPGSAAVITVNNVCAARPKTATTTGSTAKDSTGASTGTSAGSKATTPSSAAPPSTAPADCKTVVTKDEFEKLLKGVAPTPTPQVRRQLGSVLPRIIAMSNQAQKEGLDKTPEFQEMVKFAKMQILAQEVQRKIQREAANVPEADIDKYYKSNTEAFEQFDLDRLFVPRTKQVEDAKDEDAKDEKLTDEQQKAKEASEKARQEESEQAMTKLAQDLRARAVAGESFETLQKEAFAAAGMKIESPTVKLPDVRRTGLSPAHAAVFELKAGDISQVISDAGGHYIYKVEGKKQMPLEQAKQEIRNTLQNQRTQDMMGKVNNSYKVDTNEAYFGPGPLTAPQQHLPNRRPMAPPRNAAQPQTPRESQPPAKEPDAKPN